MFSLFVFLIWQQSLLSFLFRLHIYDSFVTISDEDCWIWSSWNWSDTIFFIYDSNELFSYKRFRIWDNFHSLHILWICLWLSTCRILWELTAYLVFTKQCSSFVYTSSLSLVGIQYPKGTPNLCLTVCQNCRVCCI